MCVLEFYKCQIIYIPRVLISVRYETVHSERKK